VPNSAITRLFNLYAELLLLHGTDQQLAARLSSAAFRLRRFTSDVLEMPKAELANLFAPEIVRLIEQLRKKGTVDELDELIQLTPSGLFDMMRIRGLGGRKLSVLWKTAGIDTIEQLLKAAKSGELSEIPGFGKKTEQNIITAIENLHSNEDFFHYASVADTAIDLVKKINELFTKEQTELCGAIRRQTTTVDKIEIITTIAQKEFSSKALRKLLIIKSSSNDQTIAHTFDEFPVIIYHTHKENFYLHLFERTGTEEHVNVVKSKMNRAIHFSSENDIYKKARLPYIVPEMRENNAEWEFNGGANDLLKPSDIKGVVHNHTTWSDGVDSLEDFVKACRKRGYEYCVISDHSKNAHYAGGLKEEKVMKQWERIDRLNKQLAPFKIFKSIECDILVSGDLDYDESLLSGFDMVIVSVHQLLKMNEEKATKRLIRAIENPFTTILGHMTGRQLLIRPGYPVNFKKVIDACAIHNVVIEINANPYRLDMDWSHIPYALKKGVMISVNPDAHSIHEIDNIRWGVSAARKGGLMKDMTWNALPLRAIEKWLTGKKRALSASFKSN
jgi:DNA polymerase (family 10)